MDIAQLTAEVDALMPGVAADLKRLAAIPSIAFPGYPKEKVVECHDLLVELLREAGVILLFGAEDAACQLHGPNERVLLSELRNSVLAEAAFFEAYASDYAKLSS